MHVGSDHSVPGGSYVCLRGSLFHERGFVGAGGARAVMMREIQLVFRCLRYCFWNLYRFVDVFAGTDNCFLGAKINHHDVNYQTALMWAAAEGHLETVEGLLNSDAKIDVGIRHSS